MKNQIFTYLFIFALIQGAIYPAVLFFVHVEVNEVSGKYELPVDLPTNGVSVYFGLSGNEEEKSVETIHWNTNNIELPPVLSTEILSSKLTTCDLRPVRMSKKVTTPPPEWGVVV
jgi:hypothetical protein